MAASVSASPPRETARRMASSVLAASRNAISASGTVPWHVIVERVGGADAVDRAGEVVSEARLELGTDRGLRRAVARAEDGERDGLRAPDALGVVVGDGGALLGLGENALDRVEGEADRADAHGRPVAEAAVGARLVEGQPLAEPHAVAGARVAPPELEIRAPVRLAREDGAGRGDRQDGVVGEAGSPAAGAGSPPTCAGGTRTASRRRPRRWLRSSELHFDGRHRTSDVCLACASFWSMADSVGDLDARRRSRIIQIPLNGPVRYGTVLSVSADGPTAATLIEWDNGGEEWIRDEKVASLRIWLVGERRGSCRSRSRTCSTTT